MKRVWKFVGIGLLLILLFGWWYSQHEWLTDQLLAQIKLGIKKEQVEKLLGKPDKGYQLSSDLDYDCLWEKGHTEMITLVAPENPLLPTLTTNGAAIRRDGTIGWIGQRVETPGMLQTDSIWVGQKRALILMLDDKDIVLEIRIFPVTKTGGGFFSWLSRKYDDWMQGK